MAESPGESGGRGSPSKQKLYSRYKKSDLFSGLQKRPGTGMTVKTDDTFKSLNNIKFQHIYTG